MNWLLCIIFGHQPTRYEYTEQDRFGEVTTHYTECDRCCSRKKLKRVGWIPAGQVNENE